MAQVQLADVTLSVTTLGTGPVVIAAHGFPDDASTFRGQVPALLDAGYEVVIPTMRGYAPSGRSRRGHYDLPALAGDLLELADHYSPNAPVRILGHDWGAAAGLAAAAIAPHRISHLAALAIPHPRSFLRALGTRAQARRSWYMGFFQLRGVADLALWADNMQMIERLWREWSPGYVPSVVEMAAVKAGIRGRIGAVLGYYRAMPKTLVNVEMRRKLLGPIAVPTLRLHGADDGCVGAEVGEDEGKLYTGGFERVVIEGAGHFLQRERPDEVAQHVVRWFRR